MGDASYAQTSFLGGEVSKYAQGRFDLPTYRTSLNVCFNAFPVEQGAWTRRPGTQHAGTTRGGQQGRLIAFDIKQSSPYLIEFTAGMLRFWNGATLVTTNDDVGVSSISTANPAKVTTAAAHGWGSVGATPQIKFANLGTTCPLLQNRVFTAVITSTTQFTLYEPATGQTIDGSTLGVGSLAAAATAQRILEVASPYTGTLWQSVRVIQTEQAALILHPSVPPQVLRATPPAVAQTFYGFTLVAANFLDGPYLDVPTNGAQLLPSGTTGNITLTLQFAAYVASTSYSVGALVLYSSVNYISLTDQNVGNQPDTHPANWAATSAGAAIGPNGFLGTDIGRYIRLLDSASNWTWGKITAVSNLISASLAGSVNIGNMTQSGGLAAAFDSVLIQTASAGAAVSAATTDPLSGYVGKNYSGASAQKIEHAVIWPSSDLGLLVANYTYTQTVTTYRGQSNNCTLQWTFTSPQTFVVGDTVTGAASGATGVISATNRPFINTTGTLTLTGVTRPFQAGEGINSAHANGQVATFVDNGPDYWLQTGQSSSQATPTTGVNSLVINLRAKQTAPSSGSDGTLLGSTAGGGTAPITIASGDQSTAWNYVWLEIVASGIQDTLPSNLDQRNSVPLTLGGTASAFSYALNSFSIAEYAAEAQFYNPAGTGSGNAVSFQILGAALADTTARSVWRLGTYSYTTGWPTCGTYHEARLWLAGAIGNRLDASVSGQALPVINQVASSTVNFTPTTVGGQVLDSSAITAVFSAPDVNTIFWMVPDALGIIIGTQAGDWLVQATANNVPLTPTTIQGHRFSKMGCANIEPRRADHTLIIVQRFRRKLFEYFADVFSGKFGAQNVTANIAHMTVPKIAEIAYQQELVPIIWARCDDGSWFGITYKRESNVSAQPPNFAGGHRHALGTGRIVESIAVGPSSDGTLDSLAMVTNDPFGNARHVEILTKLFEEGSAESAAWFLDDAINPSSTTSTTTASAGAPYGALTINGLWHVEGRGVTVMCGGLDCGDYAVTNGSVTMPFGDGVSAGTGGGLFTPALAAAGPIVAGSSYISRGQLVRPATPQESGARNGPALGKKRRTMQMAALLDNTAGISFGTTFGKLFPALFRQPNDVPYATGQTFSGVYWTTLTDSHSYDSMIGWEINRPYSATVCAVEGFLQTMDK